MVPSGCFTIRGVGAAPVSGAVCQAGRSSAGTTARGGFYGMCVAATRDGPRSYQLLQPQRFLTQILKIVGTYPFTARKKYLSLYR